MTAVGKNADIELRGDSGLAAPVSAGVDIGVEIKKALVQDLREAASSRGDIALALSSLSGRSITEAQIDAYTAESKTGHRFPAELIGAWVKATGSVRLLTLICKEAGFYLANQTERDFAELGRAHIRKEKMQLELDSLRGQLWHKVR